MMNYDGHFMGGGFMWIFLILIIAGIFFIFQNATKGCSDDKETPMDILKKRYARGEIDDEEFKQRRKELES